MAQNPTQHAFLELLEQTVAQTCLCKLRNHCPDKNAPECMQHHNIYQQALAAKATGSQH